MFVSSLIQYAVAVQVLAMLCGGLRTRMLLHTILTQTRDTVGQVLNHSCRGRWRDEEILFSSYLGIYCSAECNITIQKQDPNHTIPTIPLYLASSPLTLSSITSPLAAKKVFFSLLVQSRSGYCSLNRWIHYSIFPNCFITPHNRAVQSELPIFRPCVKCYWVHAQMQLSHLLG